MEVDMQCKNKICIFWYKNMEAILNKHLYHQKLLFFRGRICYTLERTSNQIKVVVGLLFCNSKINDSL